MGSWVHRCGWLTATQESSVSRYKSGAAATAHTRTHHNATSPQAEKHGAHKRSRGGGEADSAQRCKPALKRHDTRGDVATGRHPGQSFPTRGAGPAPQGTPTDHVGGLIILQPDWRWLGGTSQPATQLASAQAAGQGPTKEKKHAPEKPTHTKPTPPGPTLSPTPGAPSAQAYIVEKV